MMNFTKDFTDAIWSHEYDSAEEFVEAECKTYSDMCEALAQMLMATHDKDTTAEAKALVAKAVGQYMEFVENFEKSENF